VRKSRNLGSQSVVIGAKLPSIALMIKVIALNDDRVINVRLEAIQSTAEFGTFSEHS